MMAKDDDNVELLMCEGGARTWVEVPKKNHRLLTEFWFRYEKTLWMIALLQLVVHAN